MTGSFQAVLFATALSLVSWTGLLTQPALAQGGPAGFEITGRTANMLEIRFHNVSLGNVHADAAQNAVALDFLKGVDGAAFDRLAAAAPDWISLAYASYDSGVIRAARPVTFLSRNESDGFSLRLVATPMMPAPAPAALRGPLDGGPPTAPPTTESVPAGAMPVGPMPVEPMSVEQAAPQPGIFARYDAFGGMRGYAGLELAVARADPFWQRAYDDASSLDNSSIGLGTEYHTYHGGDTVIASHAQMKIALADGVSIIGNMDNTEASADRVRQLGGGFALNTHVNLFDGALGFGLALDPDMEFSLQALEGNAITGGHFNAFVGNPDSFWQLDGSYHKPDMDAAETIAARAFKDQLVLGTGQHLDTGLWGSLDARAVNYGIRGDASVARTAGWDANLRWADDLGPLLASLAYDGHGDYLIDHDTFSGTAPSPYVPLSLRNMESHAVTGSLSSLLWGDTLWLDFYGGYIKDRYAGDGGLFGGAIRYRPAPGVEFSLGARHSPVSLLQGESGGETSAGLSFTLGFDGPSFNSH